MKFIVRLLAIAILFIVMLNFSFYCFNIMDAWGGIIIGAITILGIGYLLYSLFKKEAERQKNLENDED